MAYRITHNVFDEKELNIGDMYFDTSQHKAFVIDTEYRPVEIFIQESSIEIVDERWYMRLKCIIVKKYNNIKNSLLVLLSKIQIKKYRDD
jgi:hypothetical protein